MRILFCGTILPERYETELKYLSSAANRFQWNIVKTLRSQGHEVIILSYVGIPINKNQKTQIREACQNVGIDVVIRENHLLKAVIKFQVLLRKYLKLADVVWAYNALYPWLNLGGISARVRKENVLILADFSPIDSYKDIFHRLYAKLQEKSIRQFGMVVGVSENVKKILIPSQRFLLMEGGIDTTLYKDFEFHQYMDDEKIVLMYAGLLNRVTGVDLLLEAFSKIEDVRLKLVITGKGDLEDLVREYEKMDSRICFYGQLPYDGYLKKLQEAHILINPRNMDLPENQNNFPSKIMEYLATGKRIISTKFMGNERFERIICFCESDALSLKREIQRETKEFQNNREWYHRQKEFSLQYDWQIQIKRIIKEVIGDKAYYE